MPKYRQLHTKIINSFDFAEMPDDFTRVLWLVMIVGVDSEGRGIYSPNWIRSTMFPLRNDVEDNQITSAFEWFAAREMVDIYEVNGRKYFEVNNFRTYQRGTEKEARSLFPPNPDKLQSESIVTPDKVPSRVASYTYTDTNTDTNTDTDTNTTSQSSVGDRFSEIQKLLERLTGIPAYSPDPILEIERMGATDEDIHAGFSECQQYLSARGKIIRKHESVVEPTRLAMQRRVQNANGNERILTKSEIMKDITL